jgi:hypothetical protein
LLVEATLALAWAGVQLRLHPFARVATRLGRHMAESPPAEDDRTLKQAESIRWAVETAARVLPWKPVCLPQALAGTAMLRRRRIASTLYLGVDPGRGLDAHAWVRVGTLIVTGGPLETRFSVVSTFA